MSNLEQFTKPLPVDNDVIFELHETQKVINYEDSYIFNSHQSPYISTKTFVVKILEKIVQHISHQELLKSGIKIRIIEPGKNWITGKIRMRLVLNLFLTSQKTVKYLLNSYLP